MRLIHGDCLEVLPTLEDNSVDMVLTDPPYGTTACKWDSVIPLQPMWEQLKRITKKRGAILLFGIQPFTSTLVMSNINMFKHEWVWNKKQAGNFIQAKNHPLRVCESIVVFGATKVNYYPIMELGEEKNNRPESVVKQSTNFLGKVSKGYFQRSKGYNEKLRYPQNIVTFNAREKECNSLNRVHPTQKPVALMEYLIKTYTNEGDTVLDFTMGSGTTGVACANLNRDFIGIELEQEYFDIARARIAEASQVAPLFAEVAS